VDVDVLAADELLVAEASLALEAEFLEDAPRAVVRFDDLRAELVQAALGERVLAEQADGLGGVAVAPLVWVEVVGDGGGAGDVVLVEQRHHPQRLLVATDDEGRAVAAGDGVLEELLELFGVRRAVQRERLAHRGVVADSLDELEVLLLDGPEGDPVAVREHGTGHGRNDTTGS